MNQTLPVVGLALLGAVFVVTLARNGAYWWRMLRQASRLRGTRASERSRAAGLSAGDSDLHVHYIIPAYQEVDALPQTFRALQRAVEASRYRASVIVVTSVHDEPTYPGERRTRQVAEELCDGLEYASVLIDETEVPSMAASFNTGTRHVAGSAPDPTRTYVAAYNADSSATLDSVQALGDTILAREHPQVLQINHSSLRNLAAMRGLGGWYAKGCAYYQSRWALGFELDMHRRNSVSRRRGPLGHSYHLKGHGLVLRLDVALDVGGFSTDTPCEDLELGFRLSLRGVPVHVVPVLEDTESPPTARTAVAQKRYWYSGMIDVLNFHRLSPGLRAASPFRFEVQRLASVYRSAAGFLLGPVPSWVLLAGAVTTGWWWLAAPVVANGVLSVFLVRRALRLLGSPLAPLRPYEAVTLPVAVVCWSMTRNLGPLQYVWSMLRTRDRAGRMRAAHLGHIEGSAQIDGAGVREPVGG
ncbi:MULTISPECIES: glycosyltransferase family 2 protein [Cellulosimicrobium]|uniref:glycosyltransferase family 2 protein n=1 Tax=Cellulosimicrobium TaxID=157920 RepID=UPI00119FB608|nr:MULTISPECIES: glycosyltransferase family 2 protein [Cellulosimicrobium]MBE9938043.1 glycosyltransferase [Cellulosimicrobium cellulans]